MQFTCAQILGSIVGYTVAQGREGGNDQVIEFDRCRVAGDHACAKTVDNPLDDDVPNRYKGLLQNTGDRDQSDLAKDRPGEDGEGFRCFDGPEPSEYNCNGQQAADALTQESGSGNACYAHTKALDEPDIHQDIGSRREGQE